MRHGRRRSRDLADLPWVTIAAVVGVIAVAGIALFFFMGNDGGSNPAASSSSGSSVSPSSTMLTNTGVAKITVKETTKPTVPSTGTYVEVSYLGSYSGSYGPDGALTIARDSGDRVYAIENANGTVRAKFQKQDSSTKHDLTVQIWKNGKAVKYASNSSAYGIVSIQYP